MASEGSWRLVLEALVVFSLAAHVVQAEDCQSWLDSWWYDTYTCEDSSLGTYSYDDPFYDFPLPCCFDDTNDVLYALYNQEDPDSYTRITRSDALPSGFSARQGTVFIPHGWNGDYDHPHYQAVKDALLVKDDYNVVMIAWPADEFYYPQSASDTRTVGVLTGKIMEKLVNDGGVSYDDIWCVGKSLGAHVCGFAGRSVPQPIGRISGLDPAGVWFEGEDDINVGLNFNDAQFVDIIHTDTNLYGTHRRLGHMDFYVNGLETQPDCFDKKRRKRGALGCSHARVMDLFTESISLGDCFISRSSCTSEYDVPGSCSPCAGAADGVCAVMGYGAQGSGGNGIYYLETAEDFPPHCKG